MKLAPIKNDFLINTVNFDIGPVFSKGPGSTGADPLYKACPSQLLYF